MTVQLPARVYTGSDVLFQQLDDESVLLDLKTERYFGLDDVGTRMWQLLVERGDPTAVCAQVATEYGADEATVRRDLAELIAKLLEAGLVIIDPAVPGDRNAEQAG